MTVDREPSNIIWSVVDGEALLLDSSSGHYFSMNPLATEIWELLQANTQIEQIIRTISAKYGVAEEMVRNDVSDLVNELQSARLLNDVHTTGPHD